MRIIDWSSDVCSSDLDDAARLRDREVRRRAAEDDVVERHALLPRIGGREGVAAIFDRDAVDGRGEGHGDGAVGAAVGRQHVAIGAVADHIIRSEEHTSELQSLMRISYAVFCLKKKKNDNSYHEV